MTTTKTAASLMAKEIVMQCLRIAGVFLLDWPLLQASFFNDFLEAGLLRMVLCFQRKYPFTLQFDGIMFYTWLRITAIWQHYETLLISEIHDYCADFVKQIISLSLWL